ncbi:molybdopterin-dependent oxidoreductase [Nocardioides marmoraquaticus]
MTSPGPSVLRGFTTGLLAALAGAAAGHLVAALLQPSASPVLAVGSRVIDLTPTPVKVWAVRELGSADKPVLIGSVLAVTLLLAGLIGVVARRRQGLGVALLLVLVGLATAAAVVQPAARPLDVVPGVVTAVVGVAVLLLLSRPAAQESGGRRSFLLAAGGVAVLGAVAGAAGQLVVRAKDSVADLVLPAARRPLAPLPTGLESRFEVTPLVTPNDDFYRVDINLTVPVVDPDSWTLTVDGDVERELSLTFEELTAMDVVERDVTMTCVSNEVGGNLLGGARWLGVPLKDVLDRAGIDGTSADQVLSTSVDGFTLSTPLDVALERTHVVFGMNGEPLPRDHGFPVRLITPGIYGYVGATKWVTTLTLTTFADQMAYWTERQWAEQAPIKLSSRIDTPRPFAPLEAGRTAVAGVAWAQPHGVAKVEVRIDDGEWQQARLGPEVNASYWRQWYLPWEATSGPHDLAVRATDTRGEVQTDERATPFPSGSSGIQSLVVTVS